jgi:hypothetical protein
MSDSLNWSNYTATSAEEVMLLTGGEYSDKPKDKAYVTIARKSDNARDWNGCSLPVHGGFTSYLPNFIESLLADVLRFDSYATMNAMFRPGHRYTHWRELWNSDSPEGGPIREGFRNAEGIARLNACWVDCDYYKLGLTAGQVIGQVYDLQKEGLIPAPTYLKDSGQGLWIVWLLGLEGRHYLEHVTQWRAIQTKLACMFANQSSDFGSGNDPARLSRIVGSINTKANRPANMVVLAKDAKGGAIRYKLSELADALGVLIQPKPKTIQEHTPKLANTTKGKKGTTSRWQYDEKRFWTLVEVIRQRVPVGTRHNHSKIIGIILRHRYRKPEELAAAIDTAANRLWKRYELERSKEEYTLAKVKQEIKANVRARTTVVKIDYACIANALQLTTAEAEALRDLVPVASQRASSKPRTWPAMAGQEQLKRDSLTKKEVRKRVTDHLISRNLLNVGNYKQLAADILDELGLKVSHETIRKICLEHRPKLAQANPGLPLGD